MSNNPAKQETPPAAKQTAGASLTLKAPAAPRLSAFPTAVGKILLTVTMLVLLAGISAAALSWGVRFVPGATVRDYLNGQEVTDIEQAVLASRVLRVLTGIAVGTLLGVAGVAMQTVTRNPLADPGILGINAGASTAIILVTVVFNWRAPLHYLWAGIAGALLATTFVYALSLGSRLRNQVATLVLAGVAVNVGATAVNSATMITYAESTDSFRRWQSGLLTGANWELLQTAAPFALCGLILVISQIRPLEALSLGDDMAAALGIHTTRTRIITSLGTVLLVGAGTALAGPISFLGLIVPHLLRSLGGLSLPWLLMATPPTAATLLIGADVAGRFILPGTEVPAGVIVAILGGTAMIVVIIRRREMIR